jgi:pyruvate kinase
VLVGGPVGDHKGINVPDLQVPLPALTDKDTDDAVFALERDVDYFALSFVQRAQDVIDLRLLLQSRLQPGRVLPRIIAKIEKPQAIDALDSIIAVVDGLMVARGDLGVEASYEKVSGRTHCSSRSALLCAV